MKIEKDRLYETTKAGLVPATQAIEDGGNKAKFLLFGELTEKEITPIDIACKDCLEWIEMNFASVPACRERQARDARARGFTSVVCPNQFKE